MNLTEGQLFTIEALNRIDGFVWPDGMSCAGMMEGGCSVWFFQGAVATMPDFLSFAGWVTSSGVGVEHPDWRNSLITREQFDSVDGWVRNDNRKPNVGDVFVDIMFDSGNISLCNCVNEWEWVDCDIIKWRYNKPLDYCESDQQEAPKQPSIDELYSQYKERRKITASAKELLAESMEKEDKLLEQIKAWNFEYGFDIRVLDESDEVPEHESESELVITDWRDLRVGDVIIFLEGYVATLIGRECKVVDFDCTHAGQNIEVESLDTGHRGWPIKWKFIRRPSK
ncbi:MAG: hypothetical protein RRZ38_00045 [Hafnia sp.]